jgi:hypothetical protein
MTRPFVSHFCTPVLQNGEGSTSGRTGPGVQQPLIARHNASVRPAQDAQAHSVQPFLVRDHLD